MPTETELRAALAVLNALGVRLSVLDAEALAFIHYQRRKAEVGHIAALEDVIKTYPRIAERRAQFAAFVENPRDRNRIRVRANEVRSKLTAHGGDEPD